MNGTHGKSRQDCINQMEVKKEYVELQKCYAERMNADSRAGMEGQTEREIANEPANTATDTLFSRNENFYKGLAAERSA